MDLAKCSFLMLGIFGRTYSDMIVKEVIACLQVNWALLSQKIKKKIWRSFVLSGIIKNARHECIIAGFFSLLSLHEIRWTHAAGKGHYLARHRKRQTVPCIWTQNRHTLKDKSTEEQDPMHEDRHWWLPCNAQAESSEAPAHTRAAIGPWASSQRSPQPAQVAGRDCRKPGLWSGRPTTPAFRLGERRNQPIEHVTAEPLARCPRNSDHL